MTQSGVLRGSDSCFAFICFGIHCLDVLGIWLSWEVLLQCRQVLPVWLARLYHLTKRLSQTCGSDYLSCTCRLGFCFAFGSEVSFRSLIHALACSACIRYLMARRSCWTSWWWWTAWMIFVWLVGCSVPWDCANFIAWGMESFWESWIKSFSLCCFAVFSRLGFGP